MPDIAPLYPIECPLDHWVIDGAIAHDLRNQLMWLRAPLGMEAHERGFLGQMELMDWGEASSRFGHGSPTHPSNENPARLEGRALAGTNDLSSFQVGSFASSIAGFSDWRLPTAWELTTLIEANPVPTREDYETGFQEFMLSAFPAALGYFWSANPKYISSSFKLAHLRLLRLFQGGNPRVVWSVVFGGGFPEGRLIDGYGNEKKGVILVRRA